MNTEIFKNTEIIYSPHKLKITEFISGLFFVVLSVVFLFFAFSQNNNKGVSAHLLISITGMGLGLAGIYTILNPIMKRFEFYTDKIKGIGLLRTNVLFYSEIEGYRIKKEGKKEKIFLFLKNAAFPRITLESDFFNERRDVFEWVKNSFTDIEKNEYNEEVKEIVNNEEYGVSEEERTASLKKAKFTAKIINITSAILSFWAIIWPEPYSLAIWIMIMLPFAAYSIVKFSKGLIKEDSAGKSAYPNLAIAILSPCMALLMRGVMDWNILQWYYLWGPMIIFTLALFLYAYYCAPKIIKRSITIISILFFCALYGFGVTIALNGVYAHPKKMYYNAELLEKSATKEKRPKLTFKLTPWELKKEITEKQVGRTIYEKYNTGDKVTIVVKKGLFNLLIYSFE